MNSSQPTSQKQVSRNAPCPCGSGKKYKNCCLDKVPEKPPQRNLQTILIVAVVGVFIGIALFSGGFGNESDSPGSLPQNGGTGQNMPMTAPPTPWEYDAVNNRHWDPDHGHWHDGPPPRSAPQPNTGIQPVAPETETPAPYEYDAANNRHWDPDHGHWHDGPPPATTPAEGSSAPEPTNEPAQQD